MESISELRKIVGGFLPRHKSRLDCFCRLLLALVAVKTVNLRELAVAFASEAQLDSRYKRLKRFFAQVQLDKARLSQGLFNLFFDTNAKVYVVLDRTNWFWGKAKVNILTLSLAYEGLAIPVCWQLLNKAGNATAKEHIAVIEQFVELFGNECIEAVLADREFASGELLAWLNSQGIAFTIRIKENTQVNVGKKTCWQAERLFRDVAVKTQQAFGMSVQVFGQKVYLAGARSQRGELMIVATSGSAQGAIARYLRRWEIECLFQSLKSRGFRLEATHITKRERLDTLMSLLAIAFGWAHKVGEWRAQRKPIVLNRYRTCHRPQYSYFRYGLDSLREIVLQAGTQKVMLKQLIRQLTPLQTCTPSASEAR